MTVEEDQLLERVGRGSEDRLERPLAAFARQRPNVGLAAGGYGLACFDQVHRRRGFH